MKMAEGSPRRSRSPIDRTNDPDHAPICGRVYHLRLVNEDNHEPHFFANLVNRNYDYLVEAGYVVVTMWSDDHLCHIVYQRQPRIIVPPPTRMPSPDSTVSIHSPPWSLASSYGSIPSLVSLDEFPRNDDSSSR